MSLQPILCPGKNKITDLSIVLSKNDNEVLVFLGVAVLERVRCSPEMLQYKMLVGRLANAGWSLRKLKETFHHDPRTIKLWAQALLSDDVDFVVQAFSGRGGPGKLHDALTRYIHSRYRELKETTRRYRMIIGDEVEEYFGTRVSRESLRLQFRAADQEIEIEDNSGSGVVPDESERATTCHSMDDSTGKTSDLTDKWSPALGPADGVPFSGSTVPCTSVAVHHAGMILFAALFQRFFGGLRVESSQILAQWLGQILQGAVNLEQSRLITAKDLELFIGKVIPCIDNQREQLWALSSRESVLALYRANTRLLPDGPGRGRIFYYDPHTKEYTGSENVLKGWCGRRHGITKVLNLDMIHTESGLPCFTQHYSAYYDLRERFFMTLEQFDELFAPESRSNRIFVLDRGIYSLDTFDRFYSVGDHVLTWEKNYKKSGWDDDKLAREFCRYRTRNDSKDLRQYRFEYQVSRWHRDQRMRRIIVRATSPKGRTIEVSILCSCDEMDIEHAIWLMFRRWLQENNFKYLDKHFGLNQITSYKKKNICEVPFQDKDIDSPEYKDLKGQLKSKELSLARLLLKRERAQDKINTADAMFKKLIVRMKQCLKGLEVDIDQLEKGSRPKMTEKKDSLQNDLRKAAKNAKALRSRWVKKLAKINEQIDSLKQETQTLSGRLCEAVRHRSRLQLLIDNHYCVLDTRCKEFFDALRIVASNMFAEVARVFRPLYGNYRNDHMMLRNLSQAAGFLRQEGNLIQIQLWLKGRFQDSQIKKFKRFLIEMSDRINDECGRSQPGATRIRIGLSDGRPSAW